MLNTLIHEMIHAYLSICSSLSESGDGVALEYERCRDDAHGMALTRCLTAIRARHGTSSVLVDPTEDGPFGTFMVLLSDPRSTKWILEGRFQHAEQEVDLWLPVRQQWWSIRFWQPPEGWTWETMDSPED